MPRVLFDGPVDSGTGEQVRAELVATLREALSNVARHASASRVDIEVIVGDDAVCLRVVDDGIGPPAVEDGDAATACGTWPLGPRSSVADSRSVPEG